MCIRDRVCWVGQKLLNKEIHGLILPFDRKASNGRFPLMNPLLVYKYIEKLGLGMEVYSRPEEPGGVSLIKYASNMTGRTGQSFREKCHIAPKSFQIYLSNKASS